MIVLDTTVLIYGVGAEHPLREPCRRIIRAIEDGSVSATTSPAVIQEFAHVRARRRDRADAADKAGEYAHLLAPLLVLDDRHVAPALELFATNPDLDAFDAFLAAAALGANARALISADRAFSAVPGLRYVDPATPELDTILRA